MRNRRNVLWWVVLAIVLVAALWFVPQLQGRYFSQGVPDKEVPTLVNEYRRTWAQIIGGFGLLFGLYFTWRRVEISQDQQVTERFTRAIDQLGESDDRGNPRLEIRLGGIYALERIAMDSPERDYSTVMEVLTAYVRENSRQNHESPFTPTSVSSLDTEQDKAVEQQREEPPVRIKPRADIQAIMDVLERLQEDRDPEQPRVVLDLQEANLQGANLQGADLQFADLQGAILQEAILQTGVLPRANMWVLSTANLFRANLYGANLQGAFLKGANLQEANLNGVDLQEAVGLTQPTIENALGNKITKLPESLQPPAIWSKDLNEQRRILQKRFSGSE